MSAQQVINAPSTRHMTFAIHTRLLEGSKHASNMTRGRMGARAPRTCRRPATVVLLGTRIAGIDRFISGTRAPNLSSLMALDTRTLLPRGTEEPIPRV